MKAYPSEQDNETSDNRSKCARHLQVKQKGGERERNITINEKFGMGDEDAEGMFVLRGDLVAR